MNKGLPPLSETPGAGKPAEPAKGVRLQKREPAAPPASDAVRDKICARCGLTFRLDPGKKFFLCPDCYRREVAYKRKGTGTRVMALITCAACGKAEYLPFTPDDPKVALCRACFRERAPEPKSPPAHR